LNPLSPSSEKKRRQRHKISHEAKEAQREKSKFAIKRRRDLETKEQTALAKDKHREKQRPAMKRKREAETAEESHLHREINTLAKKRKREAETEEETKCHRQKNKLAKTRYRQAVKEHCYSEAEDHRDDKKDVISRSKKEALKFLHRTKNP